VGRKEVVVVVVVVGAYVYDTIVCSEAGSLGWVVDGGKRCCGVIDDGVEEEEHRS
jgi:hypothetical protein